MTRSVSCWTALPESEADAPQPVPLRDGPGQASVQKRENGQWRARYRDEAGKEHARHFDRKIDAQHWLDKVTAQVVRGDYVDPKLGRVTVAGYAARWEAVQVSSAGTRRIVDNALRVHLQPALGSRPMASLRRSDIQGFVKSLEAQGLAAGSVRNIYDMTAQVFASAVDDRVIASSPCRKIVLPKAMTQRSCRSRWRR